MTAPGAPGGQFPGLGGFPQRPGGFAPPGPPPPGPPGPPAPASFQAVQEQKSPEQQRQDLFKAEHSTKQSAAEAKAFVGVVARLITAAGIGAIQCTESAQQYGGNVQIPREQLGRLKIGDSVVFKVSQNQLGIPQVTFARRLEALTQERQRLLEVEVPLPLGAFGAEEYLGFVTSFAPETGFGLLSCAQTRQQFGQDVFLHRDQFADLNVSDAVHFKVALNAKGQPVARAVRKASSAGDVPEGQPPPPPDDEPKAKIAKGRHSRSRSSSSSIRERRKRRERSRRR